MYVCIQHKQCRCAVYGFCRESISPKSVYNTVQITWVSHIKLTRKPCLYCIDVPKISINFIRICGDFPVTFKVITCNAYLFFSYLLVYISQKLCGFQTMRNPHRNYTYITGYPVQHGNSLHFLWGRHLHCIFCILVSQSWNICKIFSLVPSHSAGCQYWSRQNNSKQIEHSIIGNST